MQSVNNVYTVFVIFATLVEIISWRFTLSSEMKKSCLKKYYLIGIVVLSAAVSCKKSTHNPVDTSAADVYLAGAISPTAQGNQAVYWKNGNLKVLSETGTEAKAYGLAVHQGDIYVSGYIIQGGVQRAMYWKNGEQTGLPNAGSLPSATYAIAIAGTDVYVAGYINGDIQQAVYWKNGTLVNLGPEGAAWSVATGIFIQGSDVYVTGSATFGSVTKPTLWKNGVPAYLDADADKYTIALGAVAVGTDVYVCGSQTGTDAGHTQTSVYWKNGVKQVISPNANASAIISNGTDVYITDNMSTGLSYWKNGTVTKVTSDGASVNTGATGIAVSGADVYLAGQLNGHATYWKNGKATSISPDASSSEANAIVVVPK